ncbi:hypothetical protein ACP4OV_015291 [Aristida adscensionis]
MALEAVVFAQGHFGHGWGDSPYALPPWYDVGAGELCAGDWDHELAAAAAASVDDWGDALCSRDQSSDASTDQGTVAPGPAAAAGRRKRRRAKVVKNKEEIETQRMTHIAVERNRRRQMNEYLAALRSLMPPSYAHRGDQASIVGGAINYVRELEQLLQSLEAQKSNKNDRAGRTDAGGHSPFAGFFSFPQYSTAPHSGCAATSAAAAGSSSTSNVVNGVCPADAAGESCRPPAIADIEVTMVEGHASLKVLARRRPKQLLKLVAGLHQLRIPPLHLNMTTAADAMVLYTFSLKVEDDSKMGSVEDIATAVHEILSSIQRQQQGETAVM